MEARRRLSSTGGFAPHRPPPEVLSGEPRLSEPVPVNDDNKEAMAIIPPSSTMKPSGPEAPLTADSAEPIQQQQISASARVALNLKKRPAADPAPPPTDAKARKPAVPRMGGTTTPRGEGAAGASASILSGGGAKQRRVSLVVTPLPLTKAAPVTESQGASVSVAVTPLATSRGKKGEASTVKPRPAWGLALRSPIPTTDAAAVAGVRTKAAAGVPWLHAVSADSAAKKPPPIVVSSAAGEEPALGVPTDPGSASLAITPLSTAAVLTPAVRPDGQSAALLTPHKNHHPLAKVEVSKTPTLHHHSHLDGPPAAQPSLFPVAAPALRTNAVQKALPTASPPPAHRLRVAGGGGATPVSPSPLSRAGARVPLRGRTPEAPAASAAGQLKDKTSAAAAAGSIGVPALSPVSKVTMAPVVRSPLRTIASASPVRGNPIPAAAAAAPRSASISPSPMAKAQTALKAPITAATIAPSGAPASRKAAAVAPAAPGKTAMVVKTATAGLAAKPASDVLTAITPRPGSALRAVTAPLPTRPTPKPAFCTIKGAVASAASPRKAPASGGGDAPPTAAPSKPVQPTQSGCSPM